jgi:hypothetical protein
MRRIGTVVVAVLLLAAVGCGGSSSASSGSNTSTKAGEQASSGTVDGSWAGTWTRTKPVPGGGDFSVEFSGQGGSVSGTVTLKGSACLQPDTPIKGKIDGGSVDFAVDASGASATFTGSVSGNAMNGTMTVTCGTVTGEGTWQATKA